MHNASLLIVFLPHIWIAFDLCVGRLGTKMFELNYRDTCTLRLAVCYYQIIVGNSAIGRQATCLTIITCLHFFFLLANLINHIQLLGGDEDYAVTTNYWVELRQVCVQAWLSDWFLVKWPEGSCTWATHEEIKWNVIHSWGYSTEEAELKWKTKVKKNQKDINSKIICSRYTAGWTIYCHCAVRLGRVANQW